MRTKIVAGCTLSYPKMRFILSHTQIQVTNVSEEFSKLDLITKRCLFCDVFNHMPRDPCINISFCKLFMAYFAEYCDTDLEDMDLVLCCPNDIVSILQSNIDMIKTEIVPLIPYVHQTALVSLIKSLPLSSIKESKEFSRHTTELASGSRSSYESGSRFKTNLLKKLICG